MMDKSYYWGAIIGAMIINIGLRYVPFFIPLKTINHPFMKYIAKWLPPIIMSCLVAFCFKSDYSSKNQLISYFVASFIVLILHLWKRNVLVSIVSGALSYCLLISFF